MSEVYEVVVTFDQEEHAKEMAKAYLKGVKLEGYVSAYIRKVNPDAHPE